MNKEKYTEGQIADSTSEARLLFGKKRKKKKVLWHENDNSHKSEDKLWINV